MRRNRVVKKQPVSAGYKKQKGYFYFWHLHASKFNKPSKVPFNPYFIPVKLGGAVFLSTATPSGMSGKKFFDAIEWFIEKIISSCCWK